MLITVELDESVAKALQTSATKSGESTSQYVVHAIEERLRAQDGKEELTEAARLMRLHNAMARIQAGDGTSGRDGRAWREFAHEGHNR